MDWFAPSRGVTLASHCPWVAHQVSGLRLATMVALFRLAFATAPRPPSLNLATKRNSSAHSSIGTPSPDRSQAPTACRHTVSGTISLPFRGAFHLSLTVLVRYRLSRVFSLGKWSPQLPTGFHVSRGTQDTGRSRSDFAYGALTLCGGPFQALWLSARFVTPVRRSYNPAPRRGRFGLLPVRSPLLGELFLFLGVLRCFSSPGSLRPAYVFSRR